MQEIDYNFENSKNWIDDNLAKLNESSKLSLENIEWIFKCSHFFDVRTDSESQMCMNKEEISELLEIFNTSLEFSRV